MIKYPLPTGYLLVDNYSRGELETLSIGDYGKDNNIKADFLGQTKQISSVPNGFCRPLSEKWVVTLSTQYGCPMRCNFCDVPNIIFKGNVTFDDLKKQLYSAFSCFPVNYTDRLNIHFARMGEPIFNENVFLFSEWLYNSKEDLQTETGIRFETIHPVLTTSLPNNYARLRSRIIEWCNIKNTLYNGQAGLQFSINSTNEEQRGIMFSGMQLHLSELSKWSHQFPNPIGRKYCLNFALADNFEIDEYKLASYFDDEKFMVKITPIHKNLSCLSNEIHTVNFERFYDIEERLRNVGFDVIVFIPSCDEEDGLVTCGNAILGGGEIKTNVYSPMILGL